MENDDKQPAEDLDVLSSFLEGVYRNAHGALYYGATKEHLLSVIQEALDAHQDPLRH